MAAVDTAPAPMRNPKDSMKSTWRAGDRSKWSHFQWTIQKQGIYYRDLDKEVPVHGKDEKIPAAATWEIHRWILWHAFAPIILHQAFVSLTGWTLNPYVATAYYGFSNYKIMNHAANTTRQIAHKLGFLDGSKARNDVPDHSVAKTVISLVLTLGLRQIMSGFLTYDRTHAPLQINWLALPFQIGLYPLAIDLFFYCYHRLCHESETLWKYHRTHHLVKHPTILLSAYADEEQELIEILIVPFLAFLTMRAIGLPLDFNAWWICQQYVIFTEMIGHSGLRMHLQPPSTLSWVLWYFNCDLVLEDHDLHHRQGWKKSHNYGKQTRVWDRLFGTCGERIESKEENIDYENLVRWPLY